MQLIIKQYLAMLKESGGIDAVLPSLLLAMGITPISFAQRGVKQYGVDVAAAGADPKNSNERTLFLFSLKRGDLGRTDWESGDQAVRPSLNEILDTYISTHIPEQYQALPIKIVFGTGGELKQELQQTWAQFSTKNAERFGVSFEFWGGSELAEMIEEHMLNEHVFPDEPKRHLRKAIALVGESDYELRDYFRLLRFFYYREADSLPLSNKIIKERIRHATLSAGIVIRWAEDEGDLRHAYIAAERLLLYSWDFLRINQALGKRTLAEECSPAFDLYRDISFELFKKLRPRSEVRDGFFGGHRDGISHGLRLFELIGIFSVMGLRQATLAAISGATEFATNAHAIAETIEDIIENNGVSRTPLYDSHAIEISLALTLFAWLKKEESAKKWVDQLVGGLSYGRATGLSFPVATNSHRDLVAHRLSTHPDPKSLLTESSIIPMLAEFCVVFGWTDTFEALRDMQNSVFKGVNFQVWQPGSDTEDKYYCGSARSTGVCINTIALPQSLDEFQAMIAAWQDHEKEEVRLSCIEHGLSDIAFMASRHHRTPVPPLLWRQLFLHKERIENAASTDPNGQDEPPLERVP